MSEVNGSVYSQPKIGSGKRMQQLMAQGVNDPAEILRVIHTEFPGSKAKRSDVYFNRRQLKAKEADMTKANTGAAESAASATVERTEVEMWHKGVRIAISWPKDGGEVSEFAVKALIGEMVSALVG